MFLMVDTFGNFHDCTPLVLYWRNDLALIDQTGILFNILKYNQKWKILKILSVWASIIKFFLFLESQAYSEYV